MDKRYLDIGRQAVFRDTTKGGLLYQFIRDYKSYFNSGFNLSCQKCKDNYWNNYKNLFKMASKEHGYVLKKKYNGIQLGINGNPLRNGEMTEKQAIELLSKHPKGKELFISIPEKK